MSLLPRVLVQGLGRRGPPPRLLPKPHCTGPSWIFLRVVSLLEGGPTSPFRAEPGRVPWAKTRPPGTQPASPNPRPGSRVGPRSCADSRKKKGGGVAVYANNKWYNPGHITVKERVCSPDSELLAFLSHCSTCLSPLQVTDSRVSRASHPPGSSEGTSLASEILRRFRQLQMDHTWTESLYATLQFPDRSQRSSLWLVDSAGLISEQILLNPSDYCPYSATGSTTGGVVYANYGRPEDFNWLKNAGVSVVGSVVVMRVGGGVSFAEKVWLAERNGGGGALIYPDPADLPQDPRRLGLNTHTAVSEHVHLGSGDPFTPGFPSFNHTQFPPIQSSGLPLIPALPISATVAAKLLSQLSGPSCPPSWRGRLPYVRCVVGPEFSSGRRVKMSVHNVMTPVLLNNIFSSLEGRVEPDQYIILGAQRDSLGPGAVKSGVGTAILLELARTFSAMVKSEIFGNLAAFPRLVSPLMCSSSRIPPCAAIHQLCRAVTAARPPPRSSVSSLRVHASPTPPSPPPRCRFEFPSPSEFSSWTRGQRVSVCGQVGSVCPLLVVAGRTFFCFALTDGSHRLPVLVKVLFKYVLFESQQDSRLWWTQCVCVGQSVCVTALRVCVLRGWRGNNILCVTEQSEIHTDYTHTETHTHTDSQSDTPPSLKASHVDDDDCEEAESESDVIQSSVRIKYSRVISYQGTVTEVVSEGAGLYVIDKKVGLCLAYQPTLRRRLRAGDSVELHHVHFLYRPCPDFPPSMLCTCLGSSLRVTSFSRAGGSSPDSSCPGDGVLPRLLLEKNMGVSEYLWACHLSSQLSHSLVPSVLKQQCVCVLSWKLMECVWRRRRGGGRRDIYSEMLDEPHTCPLTQYSVDPAVSLQYSVDSAVSLCVSAYSVDLQCLFVSLQYSVDPAVSLCVFFNCTVLTLQCLFVFLQYSVDLQCLFVSLQYSVDPAVSLLQCLFVSLQYSVDSAVSLSVSTYSVDPAVSLCVSTVSLCVSTVLTLQCLFVSLQYSVDLQCLFVSLHVTLQCLSTVLTLQCLYSTVLTLQCLCLSLQYSVDPAVSLSVSRYSVDLQCLFVSLQYSVDPAVSLCVSTYSVDLQCLFVSLQYSVDLQCLFVSLQYSVDSAVSLSVSTVQCTVLTLQCLCLSLQYSVTLQCLFVSLQYSVDSAVSLCVSAVSLQYSVDPAVSLCVFYSTVSDSVDLQCLFVSLQYSAVTLTVSLHTVLTLQCLFVSVQYSVDLQCLFVSLHTVLTLQCLFVSLQCLYSTVLTLQCLFVSLHTVLTLQCLFVSLQYSVDLQCLFVSLSHSTVLTCSVSVCLYSTVVTLQCLFVSLQYSVDLQCLFVSLQYSVDSAVSLHTVLTLQCLFVSLQYSVDLLCLLQCLFVSLQYSVDPAVSLNTVLILQCISTSVSQSSVSLYSQSAWSSVSLSSLLSPGGSSLSRSQINTALAWSCRTMTSFSQTGNRFRQRPLLLVGVLELPSLTSEHTLQLRDRTGAVACVATETSEEEEGGQRAAFNTAWIGTTHTQSYLQFSLDHLHILSPSAAMVTYLRQRGEESGGDVTGRKQTVEEEEKMEEGQTSGRKRRREPGSSHSSVTITCVSMVIRVEQKEGVAWKNEGAGIHRDEAGLIPCFSVRAAVIGPVVSWGRDPKNGPMTDRETETEDKLVLLFSGVSARWFPLLHPGHFYRLVAANTQDPSVLIGCGVSGRSGVELHTDSTLQVQSDWRFHTLTRPLLLHTYRQARSPTVLSVSGVLDCRSGSVYCSYLPVSSISVISLGETSSARPSPAPMMHLGVWSMEQRCIVGQVRGHVVCFLFLQLQWSCSLCGSVYKQSCSSSRCLSTSSVFQSKAKLVIDDGTGEAHVWFSGALVRPLLGLADSQWEGLQRALRVRGHVRVYPRGRSLESITSCLTSEQLSTNQSVFLSQVCVFTCLSLSQVCDSDDPLIHFLLCVCSSDAVCRQLSLTCRKHNKPRSEEMKRFSRGDRDFMTKMPPPLQLTCLHLD
ncbi:hypothetical protein L3Q82_016362 [Scortum barcoo]|uniref:Uncharacterized protein n=1 Tax=Scortum barcoo TaxID=214431 RepID=A0ACB8X7D4_9TELE|nr:hypothetical protein L3Q82_016362 [Scortum barcoo]